MELVSDINSSLSPVAQVRPAGASRSAAELGSDDFFKLLITQLTNQDPLEPTGNEELLRQIASLREIELSTTLTKSLEALTGQQAFAASSSLIGRFVTGLENEDGTVAQGLVIGVRFDDEGKGILQLSSGAELPIDRLAAIESPLVVGQSLVGRMVLGVDQRNPADPEVVEGVVTSAEPDDGGEIVLELDTGESLRLRDVLSVQ